MVERKRRLIAALVVVACVVFGSILTTTDHTSAPSPSPAPAAVDAPVQTDGAGSRLATVALETLEAKGRAPKTGYAREQFGAGWAEVDGCDMRQFILQRDLEPEVLDTDDCTVLSGTLNDPYTGKTIQFQRGTGTSNKVQIDHVVALSNAWQTGAQQLDVSVRTEFANDPLNLLAVDGPTNQKKSDADAATWLPPNKAYRCRYVARQIAVKAKYHLWVTPAEHDAMANILTTCPNQQLPVVS